MLTLSALQNTPSSPVSPLKNSAPATDAQEAGQAAATAGFGEVLANEMSGKDRSEAGLLDEKTIPIKDSDSDSDGRVISAGEIEARNAEIKKDIKERESNLVVVAAALQPMDMTEILPGLADTRTPGSRTDAGIDARADVQPDTQHNDRAATLAGLSPAELATFAVQPGYCTVGRSSKQHRHWHRHEGGHGRPRCGHVPERKITIWRTH